jgi:hypothetical protein
MKIVTPGQIVRILTDNQDQGRIGIVREAAPDTGYDNDYWIEFLTGGGKDRATYAPYELELVSTDALTSKIESLQRIVEMIKSGGGTK